MPAEGAEFVETSDVVEVAMGIEDGVDFAKILAERLLAEVRTRVDED